MSRLIGFVFSGEGAIASFAVVVAWHLLRPRSTAAHRALFGVAVFYLLASAEALPYVAGRGLSAGYHRFGVPDVPSGGTAIVWLNAGRELAFGWDEETSSLSPIGISRVFEARRVFDFLPASTVVISEGDGSRTATVRTSGELIRDRLVD